MAGDDVWCRITLRDAAGATLASCTLRGPGAPHLSVVDALGRLQLAADRRGWVLALDAPSSELLELFGLAGLLGKVGRQSELGEDALGVEEEVERGEAPA